MRGAVLPDASLFHANRAIQGAGYKFNDSAVNDPTCDAPAFGESPAET